MYSHLRRWDFIREFQYQGCKLWSLLISRGYRTMKYTFTFTFRKVFIFEWPHDWFFLLQQRRAPPHTLLSKLAYTFCYFLNFRLSHEVSPSGDVSLSGLAISWPNGMLLPPDTCFFDACDEEGFDIIYVVVIFAVALVLVGVAILVGWLIRWELYIWRKYI